MSETARHSRSLDRTRSDLTEFLLHHRHKLTPADVGLPTTGRRRTPGLRREEVATLAGVGLTWYTWFEQGRDINVSESFVLGVSKALKLDDAECCHLFLLAQRRPPPVEAYQWQSIPPRVQRMMDELARPAYVINLRWDVIAWNDAAERLFAFTEQAGAERNMLRMIFANPAMRRRLPDWQQDAFRLLAQFRCDLASAPEDPEMHRLIDDLTQLSPDFRRWWEKPELHSYGYGIGAVTTNDSQREDFDHEMLIVDEHRHLRMILYFPKGQ
ncbi:helix-turn-helix transcriptional regulator [Halomonas huangheensis]|uniref:XRE family transcriptional regulator n=1 Tax=Halomonas huangheensis TaxID=1178482 RepID=W1NC32_9GAMM|nr:helix-turn-helix transcriptional regulator [Halomonas huangheensis]ALM52975.1 XRE family transcriptional regulator [Halomonas huangheensis]ERL53099.1 XRE family transcriptional regulator [Halomonas huangheensis]